MKLKPIKRIRQKIQFKLSVFVNLTPTIISGKISMFIDILALIFQETYVLFVSLPNLISPKPNKE